MAATELPYLKGEAAEGAFERRAVEVMRELRAAFLGLIEHLPTPVHRPPDLVKVLGLSRTLAWQIHRVATSPNPVAVGADVPGATAVKQVLRAAKSKGVPPERLHRVTNAMQALDALIAQHAGPRNRAAFATMLGSLAGNEAETIDLKTRRQTFHLHSQIWGVQVKTSLACVLIHPGRDSTRVDSASIRGMREIRRLRRGTPFRLAAHRITDAHERVTGPHAPAGSKRSEPGTRVPHLAPQTSFGPRLLTEFCSQPCPGLLNRLEDGFAMTYLEDTPLGNAGMQTLYVCDATPGAEWYTPGESPNTICNNIAIHNPVEVVVLDTLVHRDMFGPLRPKAEVLGSLQRLGERGGSKFQPDETLPVNAEVDALGQGTSVLPTPHVPRYAQMVETVCDQLGWNPESFETFRCVVEYPILSSVVSVRFSVPKEGNW